MNRWIHLGREPPDLCIHVSGVYGPVEVSFNLTQRVGQKFYMSCCLNVGDQRVATSGKVPYFSDGPPPTELLMWGQDSALSDVVFSSRRVRR